MTTSISQRIASTGGASCYLSTRKGFVLSAFTGYFRDCEDNCCRACPPKLYPSIESALAFCARLPSWGPVVTITACSVRPGSNGLPDYIFGEAVGDSVCGAYES